jgi:hypothetical protein
MQNIKSARKRREHAWSDQKWEGLKRRDRSSSATQREK